MVFKKGQIGYNKGKMQCVICNKQIGKRERYVNLRDYNKGKLESECFYHLDCWKERFSITQEKIQQQANEWMKQLGVIAKNVIKQGGEKDVIEIPA